MTYRFIICILLLYMRINTSTYITDKSFLLNLNKFAKYFMKWWRIIIVFIHIFTLENTFRKLHDRFPKRQPFLETTREVLFCRKKKQYIVIQSWISGRGHLHIWGTVENRDVSENGDGRIRILRRLWHIYYKMRIKPNL